MSDFRAYGRDFTFDTETCGVIGQCDGGDWWVPAWREHLAVGQFTEVWDRRLNPRNPLHWRFLVKSWITGRVAFLEADR
ncbi:hypothetical protein QSJ18_18320 [Gordonia sp. ABSL1-1]|uniref:hypothetical protein n=1 Tax=Gordonia sp. ABSL1-1 TaxID=3053923 RepID=UPI002572D995|nr:hypothetical protein [Gordonia sp. ABSL1-1]MDL9938706.1 hypothetical protein [Gordonia sp. ABSL1-1]